MAERNDITHRVVYYSDCVSTFKACNVSERKLFGVSEAIIIGKVKLGQRRYSCDVIGALCLLFVNRIERDDEARGAEIRRCAMTPFPVRHVLQRLDSHGDYGTRVIALIESRLVNYNCDLFHVRSNDFANRSRTF